MSHTKKPLRIDESQLSAPEQSLLRRLNIRDYKEVYGPGKHELGITTVRHVDAEPTVVKIWLEVLPAHFYSFELAFAGGGTMLLVAGTSGPLDQFWNYIAAIASGYVYVADQRG